MKEFKLSREIKSFIRVEIKAYQESNLYNENSLHYYEKQTKLIINNRNWI